MKPRGFSLLELTAVIALLAAMAALSLPALRYLQYRQSASRLAERQLEQERMALAWIREAWALAEPISLGTDPVSGREQLWLGSSGEVQWRGALPAGIAPAQRYRQRVRIREMAGHWQVEYQFAEPAQAFRESSTRRLLGGLAAAELRFREFAADGQMGPWLDAWPDGTRMPAQISLRLKRTADGAWKEIRVSPPMSTGVTQGGMGTGYGP